MVYLVKAELSPRLYDDWICGGALVSPDAIITSAACIVDIVHSYAIAGYNNYVPYQLLNKDPCTRTNKRKIIFSCVPKAFDLNYADVSKWSSIDIGIVKVDSPYNLDIFYEHCSYAPKVIPINYDRRFQQPGYDVLTYGWGHTSSWRRPRDKLDHNTKTLHYARTIIKPVRECITKYPHSMKDVINKYMICTDGLGNINETGSFLRPHNITNHDGCDSHNIPDSDKCRKAMNLKTKKLRVLEEESESAEEEVMDSVKKSEQEPRAKSKPKLKEETGGPGPCQNDHGGPLVAWVGSQEYLIGVASVFRVKKDWHCTGPYLFTSTYCNSKFIECIMNELSSDKDQTDRMKLFCDSPPKDKGFDVYERSISWADHPDGPAKNEEFKTRPQKSLS